MDPQQQFCLKWNSYSSNLAITFSNLFKSDILADVTLSCDGAVFKAHKLILAACSKKFADLFETTPTNGQCVVILEATSSDNMAALLEFMYKGEVHISQEALNSFLKSAESLQVKGLSTEKGRLAAQRDQQSYQAQLIPEASNHHSRHPFSLAYQQAPHIHEDFPMPQLSPHHLDSFDSETGRNEKRSVRSSNASIIGICSMESLQTVGESSGNEAVTSANDACTAITTLDTSTNSNNCSGMFSGNSGGRCPSSGSIIGNGLTSSGSLGTVNNNSIVLGGNSSNDNIKQEGDSLIHTNNSTLTNVVPSYIMPMYRPITYEPLRKRVLRSPYAEQELRGSVLRDGSKNFPECSSPVNKGVYYRPSSSASSTTPTEADTLHSEHVSPPSSRYENHSPNITGKNICNASNSVINNMQPLIVGRNNERAKSPVNDEDNDNVNDCDQDDSQENCAEDLRVKLENSNASPGPPTINNSTSSPATPTGLLESLKNNDVTLTGNLAASIAPADMLNVWNATKLNNKNSGMVNTADGKKLKCLYCDRLYGYETNLRAHIRQRHQGIRVPCPFCTRTFTRNNTVRRHIAREHKQEIGISSNATIVSSSVAAAAATAAASRSQ